jgi:hypothetical protein
LHDTEEETFGVLALGRGDIRAKCRLGTDPMIRGI